MPLLSSFTLIRTISLFHLTAAYFFLTAPRMMVDQNIVFILGESMRLPHVTALDKPSEASAFIAILLAFIGLSDITAASLDDDTCILFFLATIPVRLAFLFGLTGYVYLFKEDGVFGGSRSMLSQGSAGENLQNSLVFTFGFMETTFWFWIFTSLRDDRRQRAKKRIEELNAEVEAGKDRL